MQVSVADEIHNGSGPNQATQLIANEWVTTLNEWVRDELEHCFDTSIQWMKYSSRWTAEQTKYKYKWKTHTFSKQVDDYLCSSVSSPFCSRSITFSSATPCPLSRSLWSCFSIALILLYDNKLTHYKAWTLTENRLWEREKLQIMRDSTGRWQTVCKGVIPCDCILICI